MPVCAMRCPKCGAPQTPLSVVMLLVAASAGRVSRCRQCAARMVAPRAGAAVVIAMALASLVQVLIYLHDPQFVRSNGLWWVGVGIAAIVIGLVAYCSVAAKLRDI